MDNFIELRQLFASLLRRWWILLMGAVIAGGIGYFYSRMQTPVYAATTTVYVGRPIQSSNLERVDLQLGAELALTYADFVRRKPVLQGAIDVLQLEDSWQELRDRVEVGSVDSTQLLEIRVTADSPTAAQQTADEIARQLILIGPMASRSAKAEETREFTQQRLDQVRKNIEAAQQKISELEARMATAMDTSPLQLAALQAEVTALETMTAEWDSTYSRLLAYLNTETSTNHLSIVETAEANANPIRPRVKFNTLIAIIVGSMLAMGLCFLLEFVDDTLRPSDSIGDLLGLATIGEIRALKGKNIRDRLIFRQDLFSPAAEDYRLLRNKLEALSAAWPRKVILFTSPKPGELTSITVANLGTVLAKAGHRVIIVDTNLRQPLQHVLFQLSNLGGLTELIYSPGQSLVKQLKSTQVPNLRVLAAGAFPPPHPSELLSSARMEELFDQLAEHADIVLCDSAQAVAIADTLTLSTRVDGVVLVIEVGKTSRAEAERAVYNLRQSGTNLLGVVLSPVPADTLATTKLKVPLSSTMNGRAPRETEQLVEYEHVM